jgi:hypothetical protein
MIFQNALSHQSYLALFVDFNIDSSAIGLIALYRVHDLLLYSLFCLDWCRDWTAVRLPAMFRSAGLSAHRGQEAHQQLQQGARPRLLRLQVS